MAMGVRLKEICVLLVVCIFAMGCSFFVEERTYYIPHTKIYVKTIRKGGEKYGYILFSNDSVMNLSEDIDYIKSSTDLSAIFVLDPNHPETIGIYYNGNVVKVNQVKFHFNESIEETDTLHYEKQHRTNPLILKNPYVELVIDDYFHAASIKKPSEDCYTKIAPIK